MEQTVTCNHYLFIYFAAVWLNKKRAAPRKEGVLLFFIIRLLFDCRKRAKTCR